MVRARRFGDFEVGKFVRRVERGQADVRQDERAAFADKKGTAAGERFIGGHLREREVGLAAAVVPRHGQRLVGGESGAGKNVAHGLGLGPRLGVHAGVFHADAERRGEVERGENGIENVAAEVAEPAAAEVLPVAPFERRVGVFHVGPYGRGAEPEIPVQRGGRRGVFVLRGPHFEAGELVAFVPDPRMHRADAPDHSRAQQLHRRAVFPRAVDLVAHLRDDPRLFRREPHLPRLPDGVRERLLTIDVLPRAHGGEGDARVPVVGRADLHGVEFVA